MGKNIYRNHKNLLVIVDNKWRHLLLTGQGEFKVIGAGLEDYQVAKRLIVINRVLVDLTEALADIRLPLTLSRIKYLFLASAINGSFEFCAVTMSTRPDAENGSIVRSIPCVVQILVHVEGKRFLALFRVFLPSIIQPSPLKGLAFVFVSPEKCKNRRWLFNA